MKWFSAEPVFLIQIVLNTETHLLVAVTAGLFLIDLLFYGGTE
ncbi:hypothetical protein [Sediminibacillus albus]|nr:hypothetical protein [Sediminibacillus albus]